MTTPHATVLAHVGPAGDHDMHPLTAVPRLAQAAGERTGRPVESLGATFDVRVQPSRDHLELARPHLETYAASVAAQVASGHLVVAVNGRCAASLASIPRAVAARPDLVVVWLDAHADLNVPGGSPTDYLGGMAVSGPLGWWDSGLGSGLAPDHVVLVGTRSIDAAEHELVAAHGIRVLPPGRATPAELVAAVAGRPVWFHLDCDVLEPGLVTTDYVEPGGLGLDQLADLASALADSSPVVGVEVAEWEGPGTASAEDLLDALAPLLPVGGAPGLEAPR